MIVVVMGVAGVGKSTVGRILADDLGWSFYDADDFHSAENVAKMASGEPLTEADRAPWLAVLLDYVREIGHREESAVLACSALTTSFRTALSSAAEEIRFVYLRDSPDRLRARLESRTGHYMKAHMLESQLAALEEPDDAIVIEVGSDDAHAVAARIRAALRLRQ